MIVFQLELAQHHSGRIKSAGTERPLVLRVFVAERVVELARLNGVLRPRKLVSVVFVIVLLSHDFSPLVHFDLAFQPVAVVRHNAELAVHDFLTVNCRARHVYQLKFV